MSIRNGFYTVKTIIIEISGVASIGARGQSAPLDSEKFSKLGKKRKKSGKREEKSGKNREKEEKSGRKGQNREGSFNLPLLTNRVCYAILIKIPDRNKQFETLYRQLRYLKEEGYPKLMQTLNTFS